MGSGSPLVVGVDPAAVRVAFYGLHPDLPTVKPIKYSLGKRYSPEAAALAMDLTLEAVEKLTTMSRVATRYAFIESPVVGRGGARSTIVQSHTSGVVQACLVKSGFTVYMVHPSTWKSWLIGKGNANKTDVMRAMKGRFPKDVAAADGDGDLLDAAALARYGREAVGRASRMAGARGL